MNYNFVHFIILSPQGIVSDSRKKNIHHLALSSDSFTQHLSCIQKYKINIFILLFFFNFQNKKDGR